MKIDFYTTNSSKNKISKELSNKITIDCKFTENSNILTPKILVGSYKGHNYCYIDTFKRYYYINNVNIGVGGLYTLELSVDVLMSYKNDILNSLAYIESVSRETPLIPINDNSIFSQRSINKTIIFPNGFNELPKYVLVTKGVI